MSGALVLAALGTSEQDPTSSPREYHSTPVQILVLQVNWTVVGCSVENLSVPGGSHYTGADFEISARLTNLDPSVPCNLQTATLAPASFQILNTGPLPSIPSGGSAKVTIGAVSPDYSSPVSLSVTLTGMT